METAELKRLLATSKTDPVHCAIGVIKDGSAQLSLSKTKSGKSLLGDMEKEEGKITTPAFGMASVDAETDAKLVVLTLNKAPSGIGRKLKKSLKGTGFSKVVIRLEDGSIAESVGEEDEEAAAQPTAAAAQPVEPSGPAAAAPPPGDGVIAGLAAELPGLIKQVQTVIAADPARAATLKGLATNAIAAVKGQDAAVAAAAVTALKGELGAAPTAAPPPPAPAYDLKALQAAFAQLVPAVKAIPREEAERLAVAMAKANDAGNALKSADGEAASKAITELRGLLASWAAAPGAPGGGSPPPSGPTASSSPVAPAPGAITEARLATLRKTFDYLRPQSPEIAIRPLQDVASELEIAAQVASDHGTPLPPDALTFKKQVTDELDGLKAKAEATVQGHVAAWQREIAGLPDPGATPTTRAELAKQINALLGKIEPGIAQDTYLLQKVGAGLASLGGIEESAEELKARYKSLIPSRATAAAPVEKKAAAKPAIDLPGDGGQVLAEAMKKAQGAMGKEEAVEPAVVDAAVTLIKKGIDSDSAKQILADCKTWVKVKETYRNLLKTNAAEGEKFMAKMWWYRRMVVDETMMKLQREYNFVWGSVGSDNPESDYDLTVRTHGEKGGKVVYDFKIVKEANELISAATGLSAPPGILFDTNLYAEAAAKPMTDEEKAQPAAKAMGAMKEQGQDVGALMKLRRFMEWDEFEDYKAKMLDGIKDPAARKVAQSQFDEADSLFFVARSEQLLEAAAGDDALQAEIASIPNTVEGQKKLLELAAHLEHDEPKSMVVNNKIYLKKMEEVRDLEGQYNDEPDVEKKAALLAKLKTLQADATFFAAEAYHSEGPLMHVVKAGQSSKLEVEDEFKDRPDNAETKAEKAAAIKTKTDAKLAGMSANQMLQSFNENLGDLLKDLRHYASEPFPGLGFYRSSKYIERMCEAAMLLGSKLPTSGQEVLARISLGGKQPKDVKAAVGGLVEIRGEKKGIEPSDEEKARFAEQGVTFDAEAEKQAYAVEEMSKVFPGVTTLPDLAKVISAFGQEINAAVRSALAAEMTAADPRSYFAAAARA